ncbi:MAG: CapA family protein [Betaproteobacteria bacterium]|nr:CapA family protein [Betaproteobacteria bacterium]
MEELLLCAVGDVAAFFKEPESMFVHTADILNEADITFGQNERHYTDRYTERDLLPGVPITEISPLAHAAALKLGGFDVMSFASNHCMDLGGDAMLGTIAALKDNGLVVIGAGKNIEEARKPAIFERKGTTIAYLAYCSVGRTGWEAGVDKSGCAPMRASTFYQQVDYQPGTPPEIISVANRDDLAAAIEDIKKVKASADIVVVSFHWGLHHVRGTLAMYEREVAHAVIDAGADLIVGHHPHVLKGIEIYKGKAVFYSMGNFAFDLPLSVRTQRQKKLGAKHAFNKVTGDPEYADWYSWPAESRVSMIVKCRVANKKISRVSFLPVLINSRAQPVVVSQKDGFEKALGNIRELSSSQGLNTEFCAESGEIVVRTRSPVPAEEES